MPAPEIDEFAKTLIRNVRDAAIQSSDACVNAQHRIGERWRESAENSDLKRIAHVIVPDVVDEVLFHLLRSIDQEVLNLSFTAANGQKIDLAKAGLGELGGCYMGSEGWRSKFSRERFIDDFSDLK